MTQLLTMTTTYKFPSLQVDRLLAEPVEHKGEGVHAQETDHQAKDQRPRDEPGVHGPPPLALRAQQLHAQVEEDDRVHGGAQHLAKVVDGGEGVLPDVAEGVVGLE